MSTNNMNAKHTPALVTRYVLEVAVAPYMLADPRRYYAADYQPGAVVINGGKCYEVRDIGLVRMFVEDDAAKEPK